jgi:hypothetical protein
MRQQTLRPVDKKVRLKLDAAIRLGIDLRPPSVDSVRIELGINSPIERARRPSRLTSTIWGAPVTGRVALGCGAFETTPPMRNLPLSLGLRGSETSY